MNQPTSFTEDFDWTPWVLDHGLPELPSDVGMDKYVPVARWVEVEFGAVLTVYRFLDEDDGPQIDYEIEFARRTPEGWDLCSGSGGSNWFDPPFVRSRLDTFALDVGGLTGFGDTRESVHYRATSGFVGEGITHVEVVHARGNVTRRAVESPFGALVVCTSGAEPATVRALDDQGAVRDTAEF